MKLLTELRKNYKEAKANLSGQAVSRARRIKPLAEIVGANFAAVKDGPVRPTSAQVRMIDGEPMRYFTDGSLRHATGYKPGKAARKARKKANRHGH